MLEIDIEYINIIESNRVPILKDLKLFLEKGKVYSIIGRNGEGKTTFLKSLTRLLDGNKFEVKGKILFEGNDLLSIPENELNKIRKSKIKYVFQDCLKSFDQLKKLDYYFELFGNLEKVKELLEYFNLPRYDEIKNLYPYELSYGMAQRLGFVFAMSSNPYLILLDEPTSALDSEIVQLINGSIREYVKNHDAAILLTTHDLDFAKDVSDFTALLKEKTISPFENSKEFFETKFAAETK